MSRTPFSVAVAQTRPAADVDAAIDAVAAMVADAAGAGARLVLFPEAHVGGYPRGSGFGALVGSRSPEGRDEFRRYSEQAIEADGDASRALGAVARSHRVYLVVGVIERDGATLYCTVLFYSPEGELMGKHRKLMPTGSERLIWGFGNGSTMPVFDTELGRLGAVICWENYMPLLRAAHYARGIELYCAPTADGRETWLSTMRHIALEGRCFVLSANQFATRADYPDAFPAGGDGVVSRGGSCIVDPLGEVLVGPLLDGDGVLVAQIDPDAVVRGKFDFDVTGHYARPDVFRLIVDTSDTQAVAFTSTHDAPEAVEGS